MGNWETDNELRLPPRKVSGVVQIGVLFSGGLGCVGWAVFGFGMIFFWIFGANSDLASYYHYAGETEFVQGRCTGVAGTNASVNEEEVQKYLYAFTLDGQTYEGASYSTEGGPAKGQYCQIEFPVGKPELSRIEGLRSSTFPAWVVLFVLIFPGIGLALAMVGVVKGVRALGLLRNGKLGEAKLVNKEATNTSINEQPVMKLTFAFEVDGRTYKAYAKTHQTAHLEDEEFERILYLPSDPSRSMILDDMPGSGRVGSTGDLEATSLAPLLSAVVPLLVIGGNLFALVVFALA